MCSLKLAKRDIGCRSCEVCFYAFIIFPTRAFLRRIGASRVFVTEIRVLVVIHPRGRIKVRRSVWHLTSGQQYFCQDSRVSTLSASYGKNPQKDACKIRVTEMPSRIEVFREGWFMDERPMYVDVAKVDV